jgi:hypothetical protein
MRRRKKTNLNDTLFQKIDALPADKKSELLKKNGIRANTYAVWKSRKKIPTQSKIKLAIALNLPEPVTLDQLLN